MEEIKEKPYVEPGGEAYGSLRWSALVWHDGTVKKYKNGIDRIEKRHYNSYKPNRNNGNNMESRK